MRIRPPNTVHILCASFLRLVLMSLMRPSGQLLHQYFSSIGVYELKFARGKTDQVELDIGTMNLQMPKSHLSHYSRAAGPLMCG